MANEYNSLNVVNGLVAYWYVKYLCYLTTLHGHNYAVGFVMHNVD